MTTKQRYNVLFLNMKEEVVVKVFAGAKKEHVEPAHVPGDPWNIYVREPAQNNLANFRVRELIARAYGVRVEDVEIRTGHRSPKKRLSVTIRSDY